MSVNPFMYKGYFYDSETGWYYLNSRYYDSTIGRFINADGEIGEIGDIASQNLFAYCGNNPIMCVDEDGNKLKWWQKVLIGVAVIAVVAVIAAVTVATAGTGTVAACMALGALTGAIKGAAIGAVTGAVIGGAVGAISVRAQTGSWDGALQVALEGALDGAASGFMLGAISGAILGGITSKFCFVVGTLVATDQGLKAIEDIKIGDKVLSSNTNTGEQTYKEVLDTFVSKHQTLVDIKVNGEVITTTPEHPFFVNGIEWKQAHELQVEDTLRNEQREIISISDVKVYTVEKEIEAYNFEVEEFHTYYVGNSFILTHNACNNMQKGREMQKKLGSDYQNSTRITVGKNTRVPDRLSGGRIGEAKYVKHQSLTSQLRDYYTHSQSNNLVMELVVKESTTLSRPLKLLIETGKIILKYFPK